MAHNIATINGVAAMAYQNETPWHGLGIFMGNGAKVDVQAALIAAQLAGWGVRLESHFTQNGSHNPYSKAVVRGLDNVILGSVGPKTPVVSNERAFGILDALVSEFGVTIETAGALGNGAQVWMLAKTPSTIEPVAGDHINGYFLIRHCHDNTHLLEGIPTCVRVVCQNTMGMAVGAAGGEKQNKGRSFRIRKTMGVDNRIDEAAALMKNFQAALVATGKTYADMASKTLTPLETAQFIESVFPLPKNDEGNERASKVVEERRKAVAALVFAGVGSELAGSKADGTTTAWAAFNAITEYFDHVRPAEAKSASAVRKANESAIFGANAAVKLLALSKARQLVAA